MGSDDAVEGIVVVVITELPPAPEKRAEEFAVAVVKWLLIRSHIPANAVTDRQVENERISAGAYAVGEDRVVLQNGVERDVAPIMMP